MKIIWCLDHMIFVILDHFLTLLTTQTNKILKKWKEKHLDILSFFACLPQMTSYDVQFLSNGSWQTYFAILGHLLPFCSFKPPKYQNFEKKKTPGDNIFHLCTTNENHMMYCSWDMDHDSKNFFILDYFTLTTWKIKLLIVWLEILSFYTGVP